MKQKLCRIILLILKILIPLGIVIPFIFFSTHMYDVRMTDLSHAGESGYFSGYGFYFLVVILLSFIINGILMLLGGLGLILSFCSRTLPNKRRSIITFLCLTLAPLVGEALYFVFHFYLLQIT